MRFLHVLSAATMAAVLTVTPAAGRDDKKDDKKDEIVGARWQFTAYEDKEVIEEETFRATDDLKIWKGGTQIGTWKKVDKDTVTVEITKGKMAGTMRLELVNKDKQIYRGPWVPADGSKVKKDKASAKLELLQK